MATNPTLLTMPIAENGQKNTIPATQAAAGDGLLSQSTGFPPETALPLGAGGKAPTREDFNGAFNLLSDIAFYAQKGWTFQYDATQDYFKGCLVIDPSDGLRYECLNDMVAGTVSPHEDTNNDYWKVFSTGGGVAVGFIMPYAGTGLQEGWLDCDGSAVSRTMYPDLFAAIGTTWGAGDGSTTFNLPNLIDAAMLNGSYTKTSYTTAGSTTFTAPKSGFYKITVKGGGGGGAGGRISSTLYSAGGGGGEGGTTIAYEKLSAGDTINVVIGSGGVGGAAGGGSGSAGGDSSVVVNSNTYTGGGGGGGSFPNGGNGGSGTINGNPGQTAAEALNANQAETAGGGSGGGASPDYPAVKGGGGYGGEAGYTGDAGGNGGDGYVWFEYIGVTTKFLIKAFDGQTPDSALIDITQYAQDLANKADRSLSNLNATGEARLAHVVVDSYYDSTTGDWWREYADGWIEQGGIETNSAGYSNSTYNNTITFLKPMADTKYSFNYLLSTNWGESMIMSISKTTTSITLGIYYGYSAGGSWIVCGMGGNS